MSLLVFLCGLASALCHAVWNALARSRPDPAPIMMAVVVVNGAISVPGLVVAGLPATDAWGWIAAGTVFNVMTVRALMEAYRRIPFALAYPLVRGIAPLFVTAIGLFLLGDVPTPIAGAGVVAVSIAVMMLAASARGGKADKKGLLLAFAAGLSNAAFVLTDARGARLGDPFAYAFGQAAVSGVVLWLVGRWEGGRPLSALRTQTGIVLVCSTISMGGYLFALYGLAHGPAGAVSALRETSIFIGVLLAAVMLKERVGLLRWAAALTALGGVVLIRLG